MFGVCFDLQVSADFDTAHLIFFCVLFSGKTTGIPIHVFGTETHMTAIVGMALGHRPIPNQPPVAAHTANFLLNSSGSTSVWCILAVQKQIVCHDGRVRSLCSEFSSSWNPPVVWWSLMAKLPEDTCHSHYCLVLLVNQIMRGPVALLSKSTAGQSGLLSVKQSWVVHCDLPEASIKNVQCIVFVPERVHVM